MNQQIKTWVGAVIIIIIAIAAGVFVWLASKNVPSVQTIDNNEAKEIKIKDERPPVVGGECEYDKIPGTCEIISIAQDKTVKFTFSSNGPMTNNSLLAESLKGEHIDLLSYLIPYQNYTIKEGEKITCEANLITKGTCTPIIFKFID